MVYLSRHRVCVCVRQFPTAVLHHQTYIRHAHAASRALVSCTYTFTHTHTRGGIDALAVDFVEWITHALSGARGHYMYVSLRDKAHSTTARRENLTLVRRTRPQNIEHTPGPGNFTSSSSPYTPPTTTKTNFLIARKHAIDISL